MLRQCRGTQRHVGRRDAEHERLRTEVVRLASRFGRYGYRRVTALVRAEGFRANHERLERIWRQEGLKVPRRHRKRGGRRLNDGSCVRLKPLHRNHVWRYDIVTDRARDGRPLRMLTVIDAATQECLAIRVARRLRSSDVLDCLADLLIQHGVPEHLRSDDRAELTAKAVGAWLVRVGRARCSSSREARGRVCNERCSSTLRDELLNGEVFFALPEAEVLIERWQREYDQVRPHSSLDYRPPAPEAWTVNPTTPRTDRPAAAAALQGAGCE